MIGRGVACVRMFVITLCVAFYRANATHTHGNVVEILSVCPSVRPSVKRVYCDKTKAPSEKKFNYD